MFKSKRTLYLPNLFYHNADKIKEGTKKDSVPRLDYRKFLLTGKSTNYYCL